MTGSRQHLDDRPRYQHAALERLIRVGVGAERDGFADITGPRQLRFQHLAGIRLVEQARLEIEPRRQTHIRVARAGVAEHTSMTASSIGIDRLLEGNVRRIVRCDDATGAIGLDDRGEGVGVVLQIPPVVDGFETLVLEGARGIGKSSPALGRFPAWDGMAHPVTVISYRGGCKDSTVLLRFPCTGVLAIMRALPGGPPSNGSLG